MLIAHLHNFNPSFKAMNDIDFNAVIRGIRKVQGLRLLIGYVCTFVMECAAPPNPKRTSNYTARLQGRHGDWFFEEWRNPLNRFDVSIGYVSYHIRQRKNPVYCSRSKLYSIDRAELKDLNAMYEDLPLLIAKLTTLLPLLSKNLDLLAEIGGKSETPTPLPEPKWRKKEKEKPKPEKRKTKAVA